MFWSPKLFCGRPLNILQKNYKIEHTSDHGAKFRGHRPTEVGDIAAGKKLDASNTSPLYYRAD